MIFFPKKDKSCAAMLDALHEPAYLFAPDGMFRQGNAPGMDLMRQILGYHDPNKLQYETVVKILRFNSPDSGEDTHLFLGGRSYDATTARYTDGILLRLLPRQGNEHLLRLSAALDALPWGLVTIDRRMEEPTVLYCNRQAADMMQVRAENMIGFSASGLMRVFGLPPEYLPLVAGAEQAHCDHEAGGDGRSLWYRLHFIPYQAGEYCLIVIEDNTDTKIREGQYLQAQRLEALGQLAGGVAHDFNNILSIIDGYTRIARKTVYPDNDAHNYLNHILKAVQRGSALTS